MEINIFPHLSNTFSMRRYLSGIAAALKKDNNVTIYSPVADMGKAGLVQKYLGYLNTASKVRSGHNLILSERFAFLLLVLNHSRTAVICHDLVTLLNPQASLLQKTWYRILLRIMALSGNIVCISESTRMDLLRLCRFIPEHKTHVVYNGIEPFWFTAARGDENFFEELSGKSFFLMVGTDAWNKNFDAVLLALEEVNRTDFILVKVGAISAHHSEQIDHAGLRSSIIFYEKVSDEELKFLYRHARALLFPSLHEGFGWPVLEAMASGCPVIASSTSSIPEVGGEAPDYIDPYDPKTLAQAMQNLATDENKRQTMIFSGKLQASKFSWSKTSAALEALLSDNGSK